MKPGRFEYFRPRSLAEALELKAAFGADASVLAGGQSLLPVLNFRLGRPIALIDLGGVPGLAGVQASGDVLRIGAMTRQRLVELDPDVAAACPLLRDALRNVAHPAVRNRGTLGGTVAHADPAAEVPAVVSALGGAVVAERLGATRRVPASDFFASSLTNSLEPDELVTAVELPVLGPGTGTAFREYGRRHGDFALAGVAVAVTADADGGIASARVGLCGVAATPVRAVEVEQALVGSRPDAQTWASAALSGARLVDAVEESEASVGYRRHLVEGLLARALRTAWLRTGAAA